MQLKQIKYIKNKHSIPGFVEGADSGIKFQMSDDADVGLDQYGQFGKQLNHSLTDDDITELKSSIREKFQMPKPKLTNVLSRGDKFASALNKGVGIAGDAAMAFGSIRNSYMAPVKSEDQMNSEAGTSNQNINGMDIRLQNDIDTAGQIKQINAENTANTLASAQSGAKLGQSVGSLLGPIGGAVGGIIGGLGGAVAGIFGGKNRKRKLMARIRTGNINNAFGNNQRLSYANTSKLQSQYETEHENTEDDILYANIGKSSLRMIRYVK